MTRNPRIRQVIEILPAIAFFVGFRYGDLFVATTALMYTTTVSLLMIYVLERKLSISALITALAVYVFGGLTIWLHNDTFIKIKPTIIYALFAVILLGGAMRKKGLLRFALARLFNLPDHVWYVLSKRFGWFFMLLAVLNEVVWRHFPTSVWVDFKIFGCITMTVVFFMSQMPYINRHHRDDDDNNLV